MTARTVALALALALASAAPLSGAAWRMHGQMEPDTPEDASGAHMWLEPDRDAAAPARVYLNAFVTQSFQSYGTGFHSNAGLRIDPNVAPGARVLPAGSLEAVAVLGIWKDCDRDGYVGKGETSLLNYSSALLADASVCPEGTAHNRNGWVWELLPIGPRAAATPNPRHVVAPGTAVWGDVGRPGEAPRLSCPPTPMPRGTFGGVGGVIYALDCQHNHLAGRALSASATTLGLAFLAYDDPERPQTDCDHPLDVRFGLWDDPYACPDDPPGLLEKNSGEPTFTAWDCSRDGAVVPAPTAGDGGRIEVHVPDPTGKTINRGDGVRVELARNGTHHRTAAPAPAVNDPHGSLYDALVAWHAGLWWCRDTPGWTTWTSFASPSWLGLVDAPYVFERGRGAGDPTEGKRNADLPLAWGAPSGGTSVGLFLSEGLTGEHWRSLEAFHPLTPHLFRDDGGLAGPLHVTFYARLGDGALARATFPGLPGTYGAEWCGDAKSGVHGGWDCDAANWWRTEMGASPAIPEASAPVPGWSYHLRDVDCLDGTLVGGVPLQASPAAASDAPRCEGGEGA